MLEESTKITSDELDLVQNMFLIKEIMVAELYLRDRRQFLFRLKAFEIVVEELRGFFCGKVIGFVSKKTVGLIEESCKVFV